MIFLQTTLKKLIYVGR